MADVLEKKTILVIDDSVEQTLILKKLLETNEYNVDIASCGKEGLDKSRKLPDLILLDRSLPDIDGLEVCQHIRQNNDLKYIPVIFLTSHDSVDDIVDGLYIGADDYITKPFDNKEVLARIISVLRRQATCMEDFTSMEAIIKELADIIAQEKIVSFYQPIFSLSPKNAIGFEVLSRTNMNGMFNDSRELFKASLSHGSYFELETLCWKKATTAWNSADTKGKLFLNCLQAFITEKNIDKNFFSDIGIDPQKVVVEITDIGETTDIDLLAKKINQVRELGVNFSIDDFGNGFFSLGPILKLKPDFLKIKMPMFRHVEHPSFRNIILKTAVDKCRKNSIITIAESVGDKDELQLAADLNFDAAQGNALGLPNRNIMFTNN